MGARATQPTQALLLREPLAKWRGSRRQSWASPRSTPRNFSPSRHSFPSQLRRSGFQLAVLHLDGQNRGLRAAGLFREREAFAVRGEGPLNRDRGLTAQQKFGLRYERIEGRDHVVPFGPRSIHLP